MRFDDQVIFPHPVLRPSSSDYATGEFHDDIEVSLPETADAPMVLTLRTTLSNPALARLLDDGHASVRVLVSCRETFTNEVHDLVNGKAVIHLDPARVHGSVQLVTTLCATDDIHGFTAESFVDDFSGMSFDIQAGGFLAFCTPRVLYLDREAFGSAESVINLVQNDQQLPGTWSLIADHDRLEIHLDKETMQSIALVRGSPLGKTTLVGSLYTSAIQEAIQILRTEGGDDLLWKKVLRQRCTLVGADIDDLNNLASDLTQIILGLPLGKLLNQLKEFDDYAH